MRPFILSPLIVSLALFGCDATTIEKKVEESAARQIEQATGKTATVDLTTDGATLTVGDDMIAITTDARRKIPDGVPYPADNTSLNVIPGIDQDVIRWRRKGTIADAVADYDRMARKEGYLLVDEPFVEEGMATARWEQKGHPRLSLYGHEVESGGIALTLVVQRDGSER